MRNARQFKCVVKSAMPYSTEVGRKTAYSEDLRWRIVSKRLSGHKSFRDIAKELSISLGTVHSVWEIFVRTGGVSAKAPQQRPLQRVLDEYHELLVVQLISDKPDLYLREICQSVHEITGVTVSEATICRLLKRHGLTRKCIQDIALQRCPITGGKFMAEMSFFSPKQLVWVDETGCKKGLCPCLWLITIITHTETK